VPTPAQVIGLNVKRLRESRMTAEEFGQRIGEILGKTWPRQVVYMMERGGRACTAEDVTAAAMVLDVPIMDLFIPSADVDQVQVGQRSFPRERLVTQGHSDGEELYEVARHTQALRRSFKDLTEFMNSQWIVVNNIDNAVLGKPAEYEQPSPPPTGFWGRFDLSREFERARKWYEEPKGQDL
jgi:hypothetical protein